MKLVYVRFVLLCTLMLAGAAIGNPPTDTDSTPAAQPSGQASNGQVSTPTPAPSGHGAAVLSRAEADSLTVQGDKVLAQSSIGEITVGSISNDELIYILVVVLLVVVIISVL